MTVIRPNSVSGINSITAQANEIKIFKSDGTQGGLMIDGANLNATSGISTVAALTVTGNVSVGGTLTYQDVTNIDSVGIITARSGINVTGGVVDIGTETSGRKTLTLNSSDNGAAVVFRADAATRASIEVPDGQTDLVFGVETAVTPSERLRITSGGALLVAKTTTSITTQGSRVDNGLITVSGNSNSTNLAVNGGGNLSLANIDSTDNNFSNIGGYNSNGLVVSQIDFINTSHSSRTGDIAFLTHNGSAMSERLRITSGGTLESYSPDDTTPNIKWRSNDTNWYGSLNQSVEGGTITSFLSCGGDWSANGTTYSATKALAAYPTSAIAVHNQYNSSWGSQFVFLTKAGGSSTTDGAVTERLRIDSSGHVLPGANNTYDLGSTAKGWRNVYMNDLNLSNMNGDTNDVDGTQGSWTIQEGKDDLYIINRLNGKKFKIKMEEIS